MLKIIYLSETLEYLNQTGVDLKPILSQGVIKQLKSGYSYLVIEQEN